MADFIPIDMDAKIQECLDIAKQSEDRGEMLDKVLLTGIASLTLEAWIQAEPDQREALVVKARANVGAEPHWLVSLTRTSGRGSVHGTDKDSMGGAIAEALRNWERVHGADS